jgi:Ni/Fe-hydrogenase subunit HybB-like protein
MTMARTRSSRVDIVGESRNFLRFMLREMKPKGKLLTPFNVISIPIIVLAVVLLIIRFTKGLGSITNLSQEYPWGIWIGFDVITGVAFAGGAYVITFLVYILRMDKYHPIVRVTILNGLLAYVFYAGALLLDLGRPWNVINPIIGNSFGVSSVLFLVAWHFMLYMLAEFIEFSPAIAEWLGWRRIRKALAALTLGAVIFGISLSMLHQSGLGALYLMAKGKIHPLWYTEFIPILFFVSSIFAGLSMVIFEGSISRKVFRYKMTHEHHAKHDDIVLGLAKICAGTMFIYLFLKLLVFVHEQHGAFIMSPMGYWYLLEVVGFVLVPCILFMNAVRSGKISLARTAAILSLLGIVLNRLNVSVIAFKWDAAVRYVPTWMEVEVTLAVICAEIWVFRWIVNRMPVLNEPPAWVLGRAPRPSGITDIGRRYEIDRLTKEA